jgi:hypothetical protein
MMNSEYFVTNRSGAGTITHLAPELLTQGTKARRERGAAGWRRSRRDSTG